ncbi:BTB/POZ domain-containing protein 2 [Ixodes scapularis]
MDGVLLPSNAFNVDNLTDALRYKPLPRDIFIATYPKAGTTWTQYIVWALLNLDNNEEPLPSLKRINYDLMPFLEFRQAVHARPPDDSVEVFLQAWVVNAGTRYRHNQGQVVGVEQGFGDQVDGDVIYKDVEKGCSELAHASSNPQAGGGGGRSRADPGAGTDADGEKVLQRTSSLLQNKAFTDVTFIVGPPSASKKYVGHRVLLAMTSPVFEAMFYGDMADKSKVIRIADIAPIGFENLLRSVRVPCSLHLSLRCGTTKRA